MPEDYRSKEIRRDKYKIYIISSPEANRRLRFIHHSDTLVRRPEPEFENSSDITVNFPL
jgi:hypothetical protein